MAPNSNTSSLENLNGSARSVYSNGTYQSIGLARTTTSGAAGSAHLRHSSNRHLRGHTYPALVAEEYQYRDNSAAGYGTYHTNDSFAHPAVTYREPTSLYHYSTNQAQSRSQTYLLPAAPIYNTESYDRELDLDDDQADNTAGAATQLDSLQHSEEQNPIEDKHYYPTTETYGLSYPASEHDGDADAYHASQRGTDFGGEDDEYPVQQPSTPPQQGMQRMRPHSPTTQRFLREESPEERMRLGLRRYETKEDQHRAYEAATHYSSTSTRRR
ncbi:uncharacterized protein PAC_13090 [Phialocephala subalpina]|uniref:Uncharacterized protein n=1 Tax=Phialocephala subalpina TaxID=576137 RepID=A0A1L7XDU0_9HELO|nr:uncharacterized protein PAC_13090 [Phialocephala subalpina]